MKIANEDTLSVIEFSKRDAKGDSKRQKQMIREKKCWFGEAISEGGEIRQCIQMKTKRHQINYSYSGIKNQTEKDRIISIIGNSFMEHSMEGLMRDPKLQMNVLAELDDIKTRIAHFAFEP